MAQTWMLATNCGMPCPHMPTRQSVTLMRREFLRMLQGRSQPFRLHFARLTVTRYSEVSGTGDVVHDEF